LCFEKRPGNWQYQRGSDDSRTTQPPGNLLAEPPPPLDPEHPVDVAVDICQGESHACSEGRQCKPGKLCLPANTKAAAKPSDAEIAQSTARVTPSSKSGCGCSTTTTTTSKVSLALLIVAVMAIVGAMTRPRRPT